MLRAAQEAVRGLLEVLDADPRVGGQDAAGQQPHVGVVAGVVLIHQRAEPAVVALGYGLPRLLAASSGCAAAISARRRRMKSSWIGIGFSHHKVPSLSNTATRSSGGTAAIRPGRTCGPRSR